MGHKRSAHCKHLLLAAGKGSCDLGAALFKTGEALIDHFQSVGDLFLVLSGVSAQLQVLENRELLENASSLGNVGDSHAYDLVCGSFEQILVLKLYGA